MGMSDTQYDLEKVWKSEWFMKVVGGLPPYQWYNV